MQRRLWQLLAVLLAFTLVAAACGDDDESSDSGSGGTSDVTAAFVYIGEPGDAHQRRRCDLRPCTTDPGDVSSPKSRPAPPR